MINIGHYSVIAYFVDKERRFQNNLGVKKSG